MKVNSVSMKVNSTVSKILTNKWVLNIISFLALFNVIGYMIMGNFNNVIFFIILAVLVRNFSQNMIIVLGTPLVIVNLFSMRNGTFEGFTEGNTGREEEEKKKKEEEEKKKKEEEEKKKKEEEEKKKKEEEEKKNGIKDAATQGFEVGRRKNGASKIDYASTIEDAYDDLNKILGSDGIKRLTDDTQGLMKQQMQLADSMKSITPLVQGMAPMIDQMKDMMKNMDGKDGLGGVMDMAKKLTGSMSPTK
jgi:hypothetical protein